MRELTNIENDREALLALSGEIVDFATKTRYLLIPSTEQLTEAVILLRRLVLVSHKVLAAKSYFNLLRDLQRIVMTAAVVAHDKTKDMPQGTAAEKALYEARFSELEAEYREALRLHPVGKLEGDHVATQVRLRLCTEDVFAAACAFLQLQISRRGSIYYLRGESPEFLETKKNRDPIVLDSEIALKALSSNLARPDAERGGVEQTQIAYGYNLLAKLYSLFVQMPAVIQWVKEGEHLSTPRHKIDVRQHFNLSLRDYEKVMLYARQMGIYSVRTRKPSDATRYTLNDRNQERIVAEAKKRGYTPQRMLNTALEDFFMLIDKRQRQRDAENAKNPPFPSESEKAHG